MRYVMKQDLWSFGDDFSITDEAGAERFRIDGKAVSIGDKLSFQDPDGAELAFIEQKLLAWGPTYEIYRSGDLYATVKKKLFTLFNCVFEVDVPGPNDLTAEGDLMEHEYTFKRHGQDVAHVSKKWFSWSDTYGVEVLDGEDDVLILASAVVIDLVCHDESDD